ncbi:hypothetical protein P3X46_033517 [Hevea brasiliensis]|uniref:Retrotransposon gag domain-containing protein n=1 Tax=Hevea brasiliensis TaxID=3981 RepID=A0ABQ9KEH1_HEVBR|nr:hypothetical protein P3X46_033517 [Hevea brasiliensis]
MRSGTLFLLTSFTSLVHSLQTKVLVIMPKTRSFYEKEAMRFYKPCPTWVDGNNLCLRGHKILEFNLFLGDGIQSTLEHIDRFTAQRGELANYDVFKLRLFPNSLIAVTFSWYASLPRESVNTWQDMEQLFHTYFYKIEHGVFIAELSKIYQRPRESVDS